MGHADFIGHFICSHSACGRYSDPCAGDKSQGTEYFENTFVHKFDNATSIGLLLTLVLLFSFQGDVILNNPLHILLIAVPLVLQTFLIFFIAYFACKWLKLPHDIAALRG